MAWNDIDFPSLLGAELIRPDGQYIAKFVVQPQVVHDFGAVPAGSVEMHRYSYWEDGSFTEDARLRDELQVIGVEGGRSIDKTKLTLTLNEYTGPSAGATNPSAPGNLKIPVAAIIKAQRFLYDLGNPAAFHESIGSTTLLRDYKKWKDRTYINRLLTAANLGIASASQGGYYNPKGFADGSTTAHVGPDVFTTGRDLTNVVTDMRNRNVPPFPAPTGPVYHCLMSPEFNKALRRDRDFKEVAKYPGALPIQALQAGLMPGSAPQMPAPMSYINSPNQLMFAGSGYGQSSYTVDVVPTGFIYEGARFFETVQLPTTTVSLNYSSIDATYGDLYPAATTTGQSNRTGHLGIFVGQQVIGEGIWGAGPQVCLHENTDYKRFLIVIWQERCGYVTLNPNFVTVARTYIN